MDELEYLRRRPMWPPAWRDITDRTVLAAMVAVPRHLFVPSHLRSQAYDDIPLPIGLQQTISQPYIVALMTQALRLRPASRVLEVGTGSGYQAAVLAQITPHVYSIETRAELAESACRRLIDLGCHVNVRVGDGCAGWAEHSPYNGIVVTAAAVEVPTALLSQLADRGRLVIPVGRSAWDQRLWLIKRAGRRFEVRRVADVRFVPLIGGPCAGAVDDPWLERVRVQLAGYLARRR